MLKLQQTNYTTVKIELAYSLQLYEYPIAITFAVIVKINVIKAYH